MVGLTPAETWSTAAVLTTLLYALAVLARYVYRRRKLDRVAEAEEAALAALPPEPVDDPCVGPIVWEGFGVCGHARGAHYQRLDRSRGACLDPACPCAEYVPDRPDATQAALYDREGAVA